MTKFKIWNKLDSINGIDASKILTNVPFVYNLSSEFILVYEEETPDKIDRIEIKDIISNILKIDKSLPIDEFMKLYFERRF